MGYSVKEKISLLLNEVSNIEFIRAIGQTSDRNEKKSDLYENVSIFCRQN